jgi:capsular exopolysaccharide synthesis family protein
MAKPKEIFDWRGREIEDDDTITYYRHHEPILTGSRIKGTRFTPHEPYEDLKTNILSRYPADTIKSILFNGIRHGGGCTTTSINFAHSLASDARNKVLLIDVNLRTPQLHQIYKDKQLPELEDLVAEGGNLVSQIEKTGPGNLYAISCGGGSLWGPMGLFESSQFEQFLEAVHNTFDYLILDAPPVLIYAEFRILCARVDGVVLVLESGHVRKHVAMRAKKELEDAGARILGVVLNRRKHYIPGWIYRRL